MCFFLVIGFNRLIYALHEFSLAPIVDLLVNKQYISLESCFMHKAYLPNGPLELHSLQV